MRLTRRFALLGAVALLAACASSDPDKMAAERAELDAKADAALSDLYTGNAAAKELAGRAKGVLIIPDILKAGLGVGGETGSGPLRIGGKSVAYYNLTSASIGFQAGAQSYSQVLMFMTDEALAKFQAGAGFEAGVDGSVAVLNKDASGELDTHNLQSDIVAFVFGAKGLMANATVEGSKYTRKDL